ncbi:hypothetical protein JS756_14160 [Streptomyces actuosus]|uniref:Uncharacterized protein n=1 Tax=Streptomyces actuosus TaxID=1885 RepID=A0ABS2VQ51_STRAS|nr:hypothetical protein [Streptomyces actuosus]MBN0045235.1 hypothetical protein [Streptomyces actuosus]
MAGTSRLFDAYARRSAVAESTPDALDVSDTALARRIVEEEQARLAVGGDPGGPSGAADDVPGPDGADRAEAMDAVAAVPRPGAAPSAGGRPGADIEVGRGYGPDSESDALGARESTQRSTGAPAPLGTAEAPPYAPPHVPLEESPEEPVEAGG